jgi:PAS domain S-box-containing protein
MNDAGIALRELDALTRAGRWEWDVATNQLQWSPELSDIYGLELSDAPGSYEGFLDLVYPDDRGETSAVVERALNDRSDQEYTHRILRSDGEVRMLRSLIHVDTDVDGEVLRLSGVCQDVTPEIEADERLRRAQALATSGLVAAGLAHDLNNLLSVVSFCSTTLRRLVRSAGIETNMVDTLAEVTRRAATISRQIQCLGAATSAEPSRVELGRVVREACAVIRDIIPEDLELELETEVTAHVMVDVGDLERVIWNLIVNARDAQPDGGYIGVGVEQVRVIDRERGGSYCRLTVSDHGPGMDEITRRRLFEPMFSTKETGRSGRGLGLAVVHDIVAGAGGFVSVACGGERGTRFQVYLPIVVD